MPHLPYTEAAKRLVEALMLYHATGRPTPAVVGVLRTLTRHPHPTIRTWAVRGLLLNGINWMPAPAALEPWDGEVAL